MAERTNSRLSTIGLFAGIGGIELGFERAGYRTKLLCEIDAGAAEVLRQQFRIPVRPDIRKLGAFPKVDVIAAGFPCQDLSQAGRTAGIRGNQSRLVGEVFQRLRDKSAGPRWLLLENVPFMLQLQRGRAMRYLVDELEALGFSWAYRIVNTRSFGLPQRRRRVILLASRDEDPRVPLLDCDAGDDPPVYSGQEMCGFYWTEGLRGLGWAVDAIPTLKGGSTIGIPSPPAIWDPVDGSITTPDVRDAERLQGFDAGWTNAVAEVAGVRSSHRWKLIGNAVSVPVAQWVAGRLQARNGRVPQGEPLQRGVGWPHAAWGHKGRVFAAGVSAFPESRRPPSLREFLKYARKPLSHRAASGFLRRASVSSLRFEEGFIEDVKRYVARASTIDAA